MKDHLVPQFSLSVDPARVRTLSTALTATARRKGAALVIILGFLVILTGVVVAFFSRAISTRQMASASSNRVRTEMFAQGAVETILSDLKQEIVLSASTTTTGTVTAILPAISGKKNASNALHPNLVKQSASGQAFVAGNTNSPIRSGTVSSTTPSLNFRTISPERWNKPLFMEKKNLTNPADLTPVDSGTNAFVPPDWVLVARDGSNPTAWNANMRDASQANNAFVVGRYAYNVYHEGGLLDINVAGYPTGSGTNAVLSPAQAGYKEALAFADLKQIPGLGATVTGLPALTGTRPDVIINAIAGWRNYGSLSSDGGWYNYTFSAAGGTNFVNFVRNNSSGFLKTGGAWDGAANSGEGDKFFTSRQELITMLMQGFDSDANERANLQHALTYLTHFSRDINQPTYAPAANRPKVLAAAQGGNNAGGFNLEDAINPGFLTVRVVTPFKRFDPLTTDGFTATPTAVVGEPLVKKRFALNRLAWLTYKGPSAPRATSTGSGNEDVVALKAAGFTTQFLQQGTDANIRNYFGLTWDAGNRRWNYAFHNKGGSSGKAISKLSYPADSSDVLRAGPPREADFFELLKASINVGSIAKTATAPNPSMLPGGNSDPDISSGSYERQYDDDSRVDDAIIQIGANIIDQFDSDGYVTRINFDDGSTPNLTPPGREIRGVENLPYLSRLMHALVKVKQADPTVSGTSIKNSGVGALLQCPELWNPHDYNPNNPTQAAGIVTPTKFRIWAESGTQGVNNTIKLRGFLRTGAGNGHNHFDANAGRSQGYEGMYGWTYKNLESRTLNKANTELNFSVTSAQSFREPTILFQLSSVTGSPAVSQTNFGIIAQNATTFFAGTGFKSDVDSNVPGVPPTKGTGYVGFYIGAAPLYWYDHTPPNGNQGYFALDHIGLDAPVDVHYYLEYPDPVTNPSASPTGNWITYDEKSRTLGGSGNYSENSTICAGGARPPNPPDPAKDAGWQSFFYPTSVTTNSTIPWDTCYAAMDPRTSRFHLMKLGGGPANTGAGSGPRMWTYPPYAADNSAIASRAGGASSVRITNGWVDASKGITLSLRNGTNDGASFLCPTGVFPSAMNWFPGTAGSAASRFAFQNNLNGSYSAGGMVCRPGMFSQNNPFARLTYRPMGDNADPATIDTGMTIALGSNAPEYYADPDGVVRRADGGLVPFTSVAGNGGGSGPTTNTGLPMTPANQNGTTRLPQSDSRPVILNRPFRTVGELAYTFSGTPWKSLNLSMPESGNSALLDVFCVTDTDDPNGMVAGRVNLNTRRAPVLQAIIAGAYKDEWNAGTVNISGTSTLPAAIANALIARTTGTAAGKGPLQNVSELVGKWAVTSGSPQTVGGSAISFQNYDGFSADLIDNRFNSSSGRADLVGVLASDTNASVTRFADATLRALSNSGQTRVWNLMIDVVAQTGRYPQTATAPDKFIVEGEQRYWVHVAIDRFTGQVIDKQIEVVKE